MQAVGTQLRIVEAEEMAKRIEALEQALSRRQCRSTLARSSVSAEFRMDALPLPSAIRVSSCSMQSSSHTARRHRDRCAATRSHPGQGLTPGRTPDPHLAGEPAAPVHYRPEVRAIPHGQRGGAGHADWRFSLRDGIPDGYCALSLASNCIISDLRGGLIVSFVEWRTGGLR